MAGTSVGSSGGKKRARIEIIPLIDVIFFLLATFVLFTLSLNKSNGVTGINLPASETGHPRDPAGTVTISVTEAGTIAWNKDFISLAEFIDRLKTFKVAEPDGRILINGDEGASHGTIVKVRRGCLKRHVGGALNRKIYRGPTVDLDAAFGSGPNAVTLRVVGLWDKNLGNYHWYVTSLDADSFPPEEIAQVYRLRWQIELLFKEWKSLCRIDQISSEKEEIVLCFVYASLCAALLSRIALWLASQRFGIPWIQMCTSNGLKILGCFARELGEALLRRAPQLRLVLSKLLDALATHARLPNGTNALVELSSCAR